MPRIFALCLFVCLFAGCATTPREPVRSVTIETIRPRYIEEERFKRISEYLSGEENQGDRIILRSDPEARTGFYFVLRLDENVRRLPRGSVVIGEFHTPKSLDVREHRFELPRRGKLPKTKEIFIGLTGEDWPYDAGRVPAAWRFTLEDANGELLARRESFLWRM